MRNDQIFRDLGRAYAEDGAEFLDTKLARTPELGELAAFHSHAGSWMIAKTFAALFAESPELAEAFLKQTLSGIASAIRFQKVNAVVQIETAVHLLEDLEEDMDNEENSPTGTPTEPSPALQSPKSKGCACKLKNGECDACLSKLARIYSDIGVFLLSYVKEMSQKTQALSKDCPTCALKYSDQAISLVVQTGIPELDKESPEIRTQVLQGVAQFAAALGITDFPLTTKAFGERK